MLWGIAHKAIVSMDGRVVQERATRQNDAVAGDEPSRKSGHQKWSGDSKDANHAFTLTHDAVGTLGLANPDGIALRNRHEPVAATGFALRCWEMPFA